ncbi:hypothetical protein H9Q71_006583 [Fusarium xylarioides]|nr:hypothetical protein H9Q71_006583 [Fusarium xylarioides]
MSNYSISTEATRILNKVLLQDPRLHLLDSFVKAAEKVKFHFMQNNKMLAELAKMDLHQMSKPVRRYATNVYRTKDGRWYHLHGSMNALPTMEMLGVEDSDVSTEEAFEIYTKKVAQWDSQDIEKVANEKFKQAGVISYGHRLVCQHRRRLGQKPKILIAPAVSKILSVLGADVIRVSCSRLPEYSATMPDLQTGKRDVDIDLKTIEGRQTLSELIKDADVLVDGYRPGALAKLGFDSKSLRELSPSLIYMRENCYGFKGPLSYRSGWQQISDCLVGLSCLQGKFLGLDEAVVPLFPNSDYQTGLYNIWYYRLGSYSEDQQKALRNRDPQFSPRHYDDMSAIVGKTHQSLQKIRPEIFKHPEYFWDMSGKEYRLDEDFKVLAPAFKFEKSSIGWDVPTGRRGRSKAEWIS